MAAVAESKRSTKRQARPSLHVSIKPRRYSAIAKKYAHDVAAGTIPACEFVKAACSEHLSDLATQVDASVPYRYDAKKAERVCRYIESFPHIKGEWAISRDGRSTDLVLADFFVFIVCRLMGMVDKITGLRRFTELYAEIPRKNAKTTVLAALGHYLAFADGEFGAEVYCGASTEKQAMEVFGTARLQMMRNPDMRDVLGVEIAAKSIWRERDGSKMVVVVGNPGDGSSPSAALLDELHEQKSSALRDAMLTGMGSRRQPLLAQITTAGVDTTGVCFAVRTQAVEVLRKEKRNDSLFAIIFTIDETDDPLTFEAVRKANPNLGVSVYEHFLRRKLQDAINNPYEAFIYKTKHLNVWGQSKYGYFNMAAWGRCADPALQSFNQHGRALGTNPGVPDGFRGKSCYIGLDLAARVDLACWVMIFPELKSDGMHYFVFCRAYAPRLTAYDGQHGKYAEWHQRGWLTVHDGAEIKLSRIQDDVAAILPLYDVQCLAFDQAFGMQMQQELEQVTEDGVVITIPQNAKSLSEGMKEMNAATVASRVSHNGDPLLTWCMANVVSSPDKNENEFPDKERPENKIDAATALLNAMNRVMAASTGASVYETGEGLRYL